MAWSTHREQALDEPDRRCAAPAELPGYRIVRTLGASERKQTSTLLVEGDRGLAVLKQIAEGAAPELRKSFEVEVDFYRHAAFGLKPRLLDSGERWLLLEHVKGSTLRASLIEGLSVDVLQATLRTVVEELSRARRTLHAHDDVDALARVGGGRVRNLLTSGPRGTRASQWNIRLCGVGAAVLPRLSRLRLGVALRDWSRAGVRVVAPFGHGDLHGNNVLIGPDGPWVLDFENATRPGCWLTDVWYLLATVVAAAPSASREAARTACRQAVLAAEPGLQHGYDAFEALFTAAALANGRFARELPGAREGARVIAAAGELVRRR